jgi:hypothetical protein
MVSPELIFLITNIGYNRSGTGLATLDAVGSHPLTQAPLGPLTWQTVNKLRGLESLDRHVPVAPPPMGVDGPSL